MSELYVLQKKVMPQIETISGKQGAAAFIVLMASFAWVGAVLNHTTYNGKWAGEHAPDWFAVAWMFCLFVSPMVSLMLALIIGVDRRERFTSGFVAAMIYGCSPLPFYIGYYCFQMMLRPTF